MSEALTPREERFVAEYLIDLNATQAFLRATGGRVKENTAATEAWKLLRNPKVAGAIQTGQKARLASAELSATRVLEELRRLAFFDPAELFDDDGNLRPLSKMKPEARAAIAGLEVAVANFDKTDGKRNPEEWLHKIKLSSKTQALEMLAKHFKLLTEIHEHKGDWDKLASRLASARKRG